MAVLQQGASDATPPKWHEAQQQQEQQQQQQQQEEEEGGRQGEAEGGVPPVSWCLMGKHLCGAATDFSLRAAARCCRQQQQRRAAAAGPGAAAGSPAFKGLAISTCCHHRCVGAGGQQFHSAEALAGAAKGLTCRLAQRLARPWRVYAAGPAKELTVLCCCYR